MTASSMSNIVVVPDVLSAVSSSVLSSRLSPPVPPSGAASLAALTVAAGGGLAGAAGVVGGGGNWLSTDSNAAYCTAIVWLRPCATSAGRAATWASIALFAAFHAAAAPWRPLGAAGSVGAGMTAEAPPPAPTSIFQQFSELGFALRDLRGARVHSGFLLLDVLLKLSALFLQLVQSGFRTFEMLLLLSGLALGRLNLLQDGLSGPLLGSGGVQPGAEQLRGGVFGADEHEGLVV